MNPLILLNTDETPSVNFDKAKGIFRIAENSYPDDARRFYEPVLAWLEKYFQEPNTTTVFEFALTYFNTSSAKIITKILNLLKENRDKTDIKIRWCYESDDTDMQKSGVRYSQLCGMDFEFVETEI